MFMTVLAGADSMRGWTRICSPPGMGRGAAVQTRDTNGIIAALLRDLASVQTSQHSRWGYKRAAAAIRNLEAHARLARVPADCVINCWPLDRLLDWAKDAWKRSA